MKRLLIVTQHSLVRFPRKLCLLLLIVAVGSLQILAGWTTEIHIKNIDGNILTLPIDESTKITQDGTNLIILDLLVKTGAEKPQKQRNVTL